LERACAGLILLFTVFVFRHQLDSGCFLWSVKAGFLWLLDLLVPTWSGPSVILLAQSHLVRPKFVDCRRPVVAFRPRVFRPLEDWGAGDFVLANRGS
jgi:hypothetical protein